MQRTVMEWFAEGGYLGHDSDMQDPLPDQQKLDLLQCLLDTSPQAIIVLDQDNCVRCWNEMAQAMFQTSRFEALGAPIGRLLQVERFDGLVAFNDKQTTADPPREILIEQTAHAITIGDQAWTIVYISDVTVRREHERRLASEALTDPLSGLSNRRGFQERLESALSKKLTLGIIDADNFKQINDRFGHPAGDLAIQTLSRLLIESFPDAISHARLGGDEFGIVMETRSKGETAEAFDKFRHRVQNTRISTHAFTITVSVGIALSNVAGTSARELLTTADRSMYQAKEAGRDQISIQPINV